MGDVGRIHFLEFIVSHTAFLLERDYSAEGGEVSRNTKMGILILGENSLFSLRSIESGMK